MKYFWYVHLAKMFISYFHFYCKGETAGGQITQINSTHCSKEGSPGSWQVEFWKSLGREILPPLCAAFSSA